MLVLSRKPREEVFIDIPPSAEPQRVIVSVESRGVTNVRLGFAGPRTVRFMRPEVLERIDQETNHAA